MAKKKQSARWNDPKDLAEVANLSGGTKHRSTLRDSKGKVISERTESKPTTEDEAREALRRGHTHVTVTAPKEKLKPQMSPISRRMSGRRRRKPPSSSRSMAGRR